MRAWQSKRLLDNRGQVFLTFLECGFFLDTLLGDIASTIFWLQPSTDVANTITCEGQNQSLDSQQS